MNPTLAQVYLDDAAALFRRQKRLADRAIAQIDDDAFFALLDPGANSVAVLVKHMAGNMRSRWRDFLTSDGEKADRNRDSEFIIEPGQDRAWLTAYWESGWGYLLDTIDSLTPDDLARTVTIRSEPHLVLKAINRQIDHYSYHTGQIVLLCKHCAPTWQTLSIPKGGSAAYNARREKA
ncbi:MAG TPA: DUF1572 family protein [Caldilineaceae bacterium]|nr:DUF1572 family protein [Caldilineaceae bacterium]